MQAINCSLSVVKRAALGVFAFQFYAASALAHDIAVTERTLARHLAHAVPSESHGLTLRDPFVSLSQSQALLCLEATQAKLNSRFCASAQLVWQPTSASVQAQHLTLKNAGVPQFVDPLAPALQQAAAAVLAGLEGVTLYHAPTLMGRSIKSLRTSTGVLTLTPLEKS